MISEQQEQELADTQSLEPWSTPTLKCLSGADNTEKIFLTDFEFTTYYGPS